jgi:PAS domain S-box-containing protein
VARLDSDLKKDLSPARGYLLALVTAAAALGLALSAQRYGFRDVGLPLFLLAVAITTWYAGFGPGMLCFVVSSACFDYFLTGPIYSFYIKASDLPYYIIFVSFALFVAHFSATRRRVEANLRQARDELQAQVVERTQQASLLNLTHDPIFVRNMDDVITYWNRGALELYGWTSDQAVGQRSHELLGTIFPVPMSEINDELLRTGRWEGELKHTKADGSPVVVASRWSLRRDEQEHPVAVMETNNDVTERKRREEEIRDLNQELAKRSTELQGTNKELEAFAYSVSHDLRAPLRHIVGYAELLQKRAHSLLDEKSRQYISTILESTKRMGNLIDDLLAFSRIGRVETQKTVVNLEQLVREAVSEVRQETAGRDIVWKIDTLPVCYGDRSMLRLVFVNLLSNSVKFTRPRPRAQIEVGCVEANKDEVVVFVKDNGAGFDMKYSSKLFGVFQRLHQSEAFEGTGIGLATVQRIIHRHGGKVRAEGQIDQGATFYFSVPKP